MDWSQDNEKLTVYVHRRRNLRKGSTDAEALLWQHLRNRQVAGAKFRRQHQVGPFILDFFCVEHLLALEIDGGQHFDQKQECSDASRTRHLAERGTRVLRFTNLEVLQQTEAVLEAICEGVSATPVHGVLCGAPPPRGPSP